jgi:hypothetical protein
MGGSVGGCGDNDRRIGSNWQQFQFVCGFVFLLETESLRTDLTTPTTKPCSLLADSHSLYQTNHFMGGGESGKMDCCLVITIYLLYSYSHPSRVKSKANEQSGF